MPFKIELRRHDLVYLRPNASISIETWLHPNEGEHADLVEQVEGWIAQARPFTVARQAAQSCGDVRLGLCLPYASLLRKIACRVAIQDIVQVHPALSLSTFILSSVKETDGPLHTLARRLNELGVSVGVYGSRSWEYLTQQVYTHHRSDLDLLVDVTNWEQVHVCLNLLSQTRDMLSLQLDGELRWCGNWAVSWLELLTVGNDFNRPVLAKSNTDLAFIAVSDIFH